MVVHNEQYQAIFKGNAQFIFLCNPQKSRASRVCITFPQKTQKILTKYLFHWLDLITEILSFLQIFSVKKQPLSFCNNSETLPEYQQKNIYLTYFGPSKTNYR